MHLDNDKVKVWGTVCGGCLQMTLGATSLYRLWVTLLP